MDSIVYSLEEEEEKEEEEDKEEEAGLDIKSNNPNLKGGEKNQKTLKRPCRGPRKC